MPGFENAQSTEASEWFMDLRMMTLSAEALESRYDFYCWDDGGVSSTTATAHLYIPWQVRC
jgi:hypothetical protein